MSDNLVIASVWEDGELVELAIHATNEYVAVQHNYYTSKSKLSDLCNSIADFLENTKSTFAWISGSGSSEETAQVSLTFRHLDAKGHIEVEMCMEIDDVPSSHTYHKCSFSIQSEIGVMDELCNSIRAIVG